MPEKIFGYANKISVRPGDEISVHISAEGASSASAQLVRLIHGDEHPSGPGFLEREIPCGVNAEWDVEHQPTQIGQFLRLNDERSHFVLADGFTIFAFIAPSMPQHGVRQTIAGKWSSDTKKGYSLDINKLGLLELTIGDGAAAHHFAAEVPLSPKNWYFVAAGFDSDTGSVTIYQRGAISRYNSLLSRAVRLEQNYSRVMRTIIRPNLSANTAFLIAGANDSAPGRGVFVSQTYSGKIDRPGVFNRMLSTSELDALMAGNEPTRDGLVAYWDTAEGYGDDGIGDLVIDRGPHALHALGYNFPIRGRTGWNWSGRHDSFHTAPHEYGGLEFHADAVITCNWKPTITFRLPEDLKSGAYAVRLRIGKGIGICEEYVVFFVRAKTPSAKLCFLVPTASYLAYANEHLAVDAEGSEAVMGQTAIVHDVDIEMYRTGEFGHSTYDTWADGSGVCYSSYLRPIVNMRPKHRMPSIGVPWQFPADLSIVGWLEQCGHDWELMTDEDLHREGVEALRDYKCVMTGTHPEYVSEPILDALEDFVGLGGRLIYMGANGFYWNVDFLTGHPAVMEVRKLDSGNRSYNTRPGEHFMVSNGHKGGLWKNLNRPPHKLVGVGSGSEGWESSRPYTRMPDSYDPGLAWIMDGVPNDTIGDFGLVYNGAAGLEIDCYNLKDGTPPHTRLLASSTGHNDNFYVFHDEIYYPAPGMSGTSNYRVRADMVYFETPNEGAVFSTGSIAFGQSLPSHYYKNSCSTILGNVVAAFLSDGPPGHADAQC